MHTYLITGGAGFIGSTLSERLIKEGNKVIAIDNFCDFYDTKIKENNVKELLKNENFKLYRKDIRDRQSLKEIFDENNIEIVMHLAAMAGVRPSIENPILYQEVNCMGTQNILEEMKAHNVKNLVMASLSISPSFLEKSTMFGDGSTSRDYTYVDDIVDGIIKSCEYTMNNENVYEILNLGNSSPVSLKEMINTIGKAVGVEPKIKQLPMQPGDVERTYADVSKAKALIGYEPKTTFEQGIQKFVNWYKENKELYK